MLLRVFAATFGFLTHEEVNSAIWVDIHPDKAAYLPPFDLDAARRQGRNRIRHDWPC
jgi:hypothetical protein